MSKYWEFRLRDDLIVWENYWRRCCASTSRANRDFQPLHQYQSIRIMGSVTTVQHTTQFLTDEFLNEANFPDMLYLAAEKWVLCANWSSSWSASSSDSAMEVSVLIGENDTDLCRERLLFLPSRVGNSNDKRLWVGGHEMPLPNSPDDSIDALLLDTSPSCSRW